MSRTGNLILPAHYQIDGSANSGNRHPDDSSSEYADPDNVDSVSVNGDSTDANSGEADDHAKCPVELGPHPATMAALAELLPNVCAALGRPDADGRGKTSTESGAANQAEAPEDKRQPTGPAHPDIQPNAASFQADLVRSVANGNSFHSGSLNVQQPEANENSADGSPPGSQPDPGSQPSLPPDLNSHPDPKSPPDPGADPEAKPKPARRSGRTGTSAKPRPRKQRKPATYAIYNELVQRLPMRASNDPILGMPVEQYLEMARVAAAGILDKRRERQGEVVHPMSLPMKIVMWLAALGINAANWFNTLDDFEQLYQCGSTA